MFRKLKPILPLIVGIVALGCFVLSSNSNIIADTLSYWITNPGAASTVNGNSGKPGVASVGTHGEQFATLYGTIPWPTAIATPIPQFTQVPQFTQIPIPTQIPFQTPLTTEVTPIVKVIFLATVVPTAYSTPSAVDAAGLKYSTVFNGTNQPIDCAINGGTISFQSVQSGERWYQNWKQDGVKVSSGIACIHTGTLPTTGQIEIGGFN